MTSAFITGHVGTAILWFSLLLSLVFSLGFNLPPEVQHQAKNFEQLLVFQQTRAIKDIAEVDLQILHIGISAPSGPNKEQITFLNVRTKRVSRDLFYVFQYCFLL